MPDTPAASRPSLPSRRADLALAVMIFSYATLYIAMSWLRFATFHAQIDMSFYLRLIWGVGHGHPDLPLVQAPHFLGLHLEPVILPLAALSALSAPMPALILSLQAIAVAYLALPAYRLGTRHLGPGLPALAAAACALLYPTVTIANLHDFHPVTLAMAPLLGVVDALDEGERAHRRALVLGALALCCREDVAVQLALLCLLVAARSRAGAGERARRRTGLTALGLAAALLSYFFIYVLLVQPRWLPPFGSYGLHFRIGGAAHSARDVLALLLHQPLTVARHLLSGDRPLYPLVLLWPVAFLPLLSPRYLIGALPILGINLLSDLPRVRTLETHYAAAIVPFLIAAAILGAGRAARLARQGWSRAAPACLLALCALCAHIGYGGSPLALRYNPQVFCDAESAEMVRAALRQIPPQASVAARPGPLAHMAERPRFLSPPEYEDGRPVEYIVWIY